MTGLKIGDKVTDKEGLWETEYTLAFIDGEQAVLKTPRGQLSVCQLNRLVPAFVPHLFTDEERQDFIDKYGATKFKIKHGDLLSDEYEIIGLGYEYDSGIVIKDAYKTNKTFIKKESIEALNEKKDIIWSIPKTIFTGEMWVRHSERYDGKAPDGKSDECSSVINGIVYSGDRLVEVMPKISGKTIKFTIEVIPDRRF